MNIDVAIAQLREAIKTELYDLGELPDDVQPSYDDDHDGTELILTLLDEEDADDLPIMIEMCAHRDGGRVDTVVQLSLDDARHFHARFGAAIREASKR